MANGNTLSQEEFQRRVWKFNPRIKVVGQYIGLLERVKVKCDCGTVFNADPQRLVYKQRGGARAQEACPSCKKCIVYKKTTQQFKADLKTTRPDVKLIGEYTGVSIEHTFKSVTCGHLFSTIPDRVLSGDVGLGGCTKCKFKNTRIEKQRALLKQLAKRKPHLRVVGELGGDRVTMRCTKDGHTWKAKLNEVVFQKHACVLCAQLETGYQRKVVSVGGRKFSVQGYEPQFLRKLHRTRPELLKEIKAGHEVPHFIYRDGKQRTYRPDFFIPSLNLIVEVKSTHTAAGRPEWRNNLRNKRKAVLKAGFEFRLCVFDGAGRLLQLNPDWHTKRVTARTITR